MEKLVKKVFTVCGEESDISIVCNEQIVEEIGFFGLTGKFGLSLGIANHLDINRYLKMSQSFSVITVEEVHIGTTVRVIPVVIDEFTIGAVKRYLGREVILNVSELAYYCKLAAEQSIAMGI
jgi:hypothetical protein